MAGGGPQLLRGWRARLVARWQRRWRLTRRGRVVVAGLGFLLVVGVGSLVDSTARHPPVAKGLPATRPTATRPTTSEQPGRAPRPNSRKFTLVATGDVLIHSPVLRQAGVYGRRVGQLLALRAH
jgi:hypothetical protein